MEKAHPDVFGLLLQVLDDGRLTDSQGRTVDFKNTVIIMTSNVGSEAIAELGLELDSSDMARKEEEVSEAVREAMAGTFRPEFLNRIDETIIFRPLGREDLRSIAKLQLNRVQERLEEKDITLDISEAALDVVAERGYDPTFGARPVKRSIIANVETPLAKKGLSGEIEDGDAVKVDKGPDGNLTFTATKGANLPTTTSASPGAPGGTVTTTTTTTTTTEAEAPKQRPSFFNLGRG
jgi:ATP-dependent Clp protease ATP-binding subunit ClpB